VRDSRPDAILLDLLLPGLDGFEVADQLKADPAAVRIPIIVVTALGDDASFHRTWETGFASHLAKPIVLDQVAAVLTRVLNSSAA
jgi:CheY-like chemotaxis protein